MCWMLAVFIIQELTPWWRRISWAVCLKHWMKKRWGWPRMAGENVWPPQMEETRKALRSNPVNFQRCVPKIPEWPCNSCYGNSEWQVQVKMLIFHLYLNQLCLIIPFFLVKAWLWNIWKLTEFRGEWSSIYGGLALQAFDQIHPRGALMCRLT